jgi:hypothetical protein
VGQERKRRVIGLKVAGSVCVFRFVLVSSSCQFDSVARDSSESISEDVVDLTFGVNLY